MTSKKFRAEILTDEVQYELNEDVAESFCGMDVTVGPQTQQEKIKDVAGIVEDCWYDDSIFVEITVFDEFVSEKLSDGSLFVCPVIKREIGDTNKIEGLDVFVSYYPGEAVGDVESVE